MDRTKYNGNKSLLGFMILLLVPSLILISSLLYDPAINIYVGTVMDVPIKIEIFGSDAMRAMDDAIKEIALADQCLGPTHPISKILHMNRNAGIFPFRSFDPPLAQLKKSCYWAEKTSGAYEPTLLPLLDAWGFTTGDKLVPDKESLTRAKALVDWKHLKANESIMALDEKEMGIHLGGLDHGYAVEQAAEILATHHVKSAMIRLRRTIYPYGTDPFGQTWNVSLPDPENGQGTFATVEVKGLSLATAAPWQNQFKQDGKTYHYLLDPQTGYPVENGLLSVTVLAPSAMDAEALATAAFVSGLEAGCKLIEDQPGIEAVFVTDSHEVTVTPGLSGKLRLTDPEYTLLP